MITPGLYRRSLWHALQFRLLLLCAAGALLPTLLAAIPVFRVLSPLFDHSPRAKELVAALDSQAAIDVLRQLGDAQTSGNLAAGFTAAIVAALLVGPFLAGAALLVARADETVRTRALLASAGEHYGRLFRVALAGLVPLGIAAALAGVFFRAAETAAERAMTESQAARGGRLALAGSILLVFLAQLCIDAARAMFAAEPWRKSALLASFAGVRLVVRRPLRSIGLGLSTLLAGGGLALLLLLLRIRVPQTGTASVLLAFAIAQLAAASIGWHRTARLVGFAELARADSADRERRSAFAMRPAETPRPVDPPARPSAVLDALAPPVSVPPPVQDTPGARFPATPERATEERPALSGPRHSGT